LAEFITSVITGSDLEMLCSILFSTGASIKDIQARLEHTDIQTTMNIYAHVT